MKILVSGSHGLVGSALVTSLNKDGHQVLTLVRREPRSANEVEWQPDNGVHHSAEMDGLDAVVHLAGESIADGRWSEEKKQRIRDSRVKATTLLSAAIASLNNPPQTFIGASAIGYYGDRGDELLTESSTPGNDFLSEVCVQWEQATAAVSAKGIRVIHARFGVILSAKGGALAKMLPPFRMGVGGRVGSGKQWMSWIALDDVIGGLQFVLGQQDVCGPVNFVAPNAVTNAEFTKKLGKALSRPTIFPVPAFGARLAFGEMADALLLSSQHVQPAVLQSSGYRFTYPQLASALKAILD